MKTTTPSPEQIAALHVWSTKHGHTWKSKLREAWMTGDYDGFEGSSHLQQIRNTFGPSCVKLLPGGGLSTKERPTGMFTVESQFMG